MREVPFHGITCQNLPSSSAMKLITWNIQWCRGCDGRVNPARIVAAAREIADFDVLCLQEVACNYPDLPGTLGENQFETLAGLLADYTVVKGVATDALSPEGARREFGNAIVTRLPVLQVFRHTLPWPADAAVPSMQRSAVEAVLGLSSGPLRVTTTHLEYYSAAQRAAQVERLRDLQTEAAGHAGAPRHPEKEHGPFQRIPRPASSILTADFNFPPEDPLHARLQAPLAPGVPSYRDAWQVRNPGDPHPPTLGVHDKEQWPGPAFACDFIFVTEDLAGRVEDVAVNGATDVSDHQPVLLALRD
jgi:endonuclease/exonuclease/phosphatase family metal-dependent hydrolase